jgi:spore coat polysaccharide biosynthesis predicted glycosyltransferase SpsG
MAWADVAVAAAGSTAYELAFMGLPSLIFTIVENQNENARNLIVDGTFVSFVNESRIFFQWLNESNYAKRVEMSIQQGKLTDGFGVDRIFAFIKK